MSKLTYTDATGVHEVNGVVETEGITLEGIDKDTEWVFTGKDDTPETTNTDFIGGRPDDR
jgi:hypothetical protein